MKHLLVTNDFPPKIGGIQSYLWELWRRLPPTEAAVLTTPYRGAAAFDAAHDLQVIRTRQPVLLPTPGLVALIDRVAAEVDAELVLLDPAIPAGLVGPWLDRPYGVVLHGAEVTVPARLPMTSDLLRRTIRGARIVIAAGPYPARQAELLTGGPLPIVDVPPGVDIERFRPLTEPERQAARARFGLDEHAPLVVSVSRLVPRKGMDVLVAAAARSTRAVPDLQVAIAGTGRDRGRIARQIERLAAPVCLLGRVPDEELPQLVGCADLFAMLCRDRWLGIEQEGFGIVFLEAAAAGVPQLAGASGGSSDAVADGETGVVVTGPGDVGLVSEALDSLLAEPDRMRELGEHSRLRAAGCFSYDVLAGRLRDAVNAVDPTSGPVS